MGTRVTQPIRRCQVRWTIIASLLLFRFIELSVQQPEPLPPLTLINDPMVMNILHKMALVIRHKENISYKPVPEGMGGQYAEPTQPSGAPYSHLHLTVPQAQSLLENLKNEYNVTDEEFANLTGDTRAKRGYAHVLPIFRQNECLKTPAGHEYVGKMARTVSGFPCQRWDSQTPHAHPFTDSSAFPDGSVSVASNYCRNPNPRFKKGVWCYTNADSFTRWELCDVPLCGSPSKTRDSGVRIYRTAFTFGKRSTDDLLMRRRRSAPQSRRRGGRR